MADTAGRAAAAEQPRTILRRVRSREDAVTSPAEQPARVRLLMSVREADALAARLVEVPRTLWVRRTLDQLWLRSVLVDQWRRTRVAERSAFEIRANRILTAIDPPQLEQPVKR